MDQQVRDQIKLACFFFGRAKTVATNAGVDVSNFSKWLRGSPTLSEANVGRILGALGLPDLKPDCSRVHIWQIDSTPMAGMGSLDIASAFTLYMPKGGRLAKSPWGKIGLRNLIPFQPGVVYAVTDGNFRAILRLAPGLLIQPRQMRAPFKWRNGTVAKSLLNLSEPGKPWSEGIPTIDEFDRLWNDPTPPATLDDVRAAAREAGITYSDIITLIRDSQR